jgi:hypothetical protein
LGVETFEFCSSVVDFELPVDTTFFLVCSFRPGSNFSLQLVKFADPPSGEALTCHAPQFALRNVEPTAMLWREHKVDPLQICSGNGWFKNVIEGTFGMRVQVV